MFYFCQKHNTLSFAGNPTESQPTPPPCFFLLLFFLLLGMWLISWLLLGSILHVFAYCGLVVEIQTHLTAKIQIVAPLPTSAKISLFCQRQNTLLSPGNPHPPCFSLGIWLISFGFPWRFSQNAPPPVGTTPRGLEAAAAAAVQAWTGARKVWRWIFAFSFSICLGTCFVFFDFHLGNLSLLRLVGNILQVGGSSLVSFKTIQKRAPYELFWSFQPVGFMLDEPAPPKKSWNDDSLSKPFLGSSARCPS